MKNVVNSCPQNATEVLESSTRLGCGQDKYGNDQYICVSNRNKTGLVELCYNGVMELIQRGNCLETDGEQLYYVDCLGFSSGCPGNDYPSNTIYQYPACQSINTEQQCYLAEVSCPNSTGNGVKTRETTETSSLDLTTIRSSYNSTINIFESTVSQEKHDSTGIIVGSLVAVVFITILVLAAVLWKWKRNKDKRRTPSLVASASKDAGVPEDEQPLLTHTNPSDDTKNLQETLSVELEQQENVNDVTDVHFLSDSESFKDALANIKSKERDKDIAEIRVKTEPKKKILFIQETEIHTEMGKRKHGVQKSDVNSELERSEHEITETRVNSEQKEREYIVAETGVDNKQDETENGVTEDGLSTEEEEEGFPSDTEENVSCDSVYSDKFSTLTDDKVSVLFCFLCSDSGPPDFTDKEWLDLLNVIRQKVYAKENPVTREEAQHTLDRLKSRDYLWEDQEKITEDTKDETIEIQQRTWREVCQ
ncbi:uncharacterized protein LOC134272034 [Saccostrea cucullata]|uniref:uncharacterized protein LOC134272034 n=1 Tax=Saccostrea cuccullata TaxID=36930 RepID=UPI002ED5CAB3